MGCPLPNAEDARIHAVSMRVSHDLSATNDVYFFNNPSSLKVRELIAGGNSKCLCVGFILFINIFVYVPCQRV